MIYHYLEPYVRNDGCAERVSETVREPAGFSHIAFGIVDSDQELNASPMVPDSAASHGMDRLMSTLQQLKSRKLCSKGHGVNHDPLYHPRREPHRKTISLSMKFSEGGALDPAA